MWSQRNWSSFISCYSKTTIWRLLEILALLTHTYAGVIHAFLHKSWFDKLKLIYVLILRIWNCGVDISLTLLYKRLLLNNGVSDHHWQWLMSNRLFLCLKLIPVWHNLQSAFSFLHLESLHNIWGLMVTPFGQLNGRWLRQCYLIQDLLYMLFSVCYTSKSRIIEFQMLTHCL